MTELGHQRENIQKSNLKHKTIFEVISNTQIRRLQVNIN
jgi:hypothetical protein